MPSRPPLRPERARLRSSRRPTCAYIRRHEWKIALKSLAGDIVDRDLRSTKRVMIRGMQERRSLLPRGHGADALSLRRALVDECREEKIASNIASGAN